LANLNKLLQPHPSAPSRPGHPIGPSPPPHRPPRPTRASPWAPPLPNRLHHSLSLYMDADHPSPSALVHFLLLSPLSHSPSQSSRSQPMKPRRAHPLNRCCKLAVKMAVDSDHLHSSSSHPRDLLLSTYLTILFFPSRNTEDHRPYPRCIAPDADGADIPRHEASIQDHPWSLRSLRIRPRPPPAAGDRPR
jgi:hypothetical protein